MEGVPECTECGVCCTGSAEGYVAVTGDDWSRLGDDAERWASFDGRRAFMKMAATTGDEATGDEAPGARCSALEVGPRLLCAIYSRRPEVCRSLAHGSPACRAERARKRHPRALPIAR